MFLKVYGSEARNPKLKGRIWSFGQIWSKGIWSSQVTDVATHLLHVYLASPEPPVFMTQPGPWDDITPSFVVPFSFPDLTKGS